MKFSEYLKQQRTARYMTMKDLAGFFGVSAGFINDIEKGNRLPSTALTKIIVEAFELSDSEAVQVYDMIAEEKGSVPDDIVRLLLENKERLGEIREFFRGDLMAASKDMYEALVAIKHALDKLPGGLPNSTFTDPYFKIREALVKAEGGSQCK